MIADGYAQGYRSHLIARHDAFPGLVVSGLAETFALQGWLKLPIRLDDEEVRNLKDAVLRKQADPRIYASDVDDQVRGVGLMRMFEFSQLFRDLIVREPIAGFVEHILGEECHIIAQTALVTPRGNGIVNWHIDDQLFFPASMLLPLADDVPVPCNALNVMIPLTPIDSLDCGPTQVVPGSHRSGVPGPGNAAPEFRGQGPVSILAEPGDIYVINNQTWHRGAQNNSDRTRIVLTTGYARRFVSQRFYPFLNYAMPAHVLDGADPRTLRFLGMHPKGPYG